MSLSQVATYSHYTMEEVSIMENLDRPVQPEETKKSTVDEAPEIVCLGSISEITLGKVSRQSDGATWSQME